MSWKQDRTPNLNDQTMTVSEGGKVLSSWCGWCLAVAETAFGTPRDYPTAYAAWQNAKYKHTDQNWPLNVYFAIFYSWVSGGVNYGHVAVAHWDGKTLQIWSAPYTDKPYFDRFTNDLNLGGRYGGIHYLGWAEDLATVRLCHYVDDKITIAQLTQLYKDLLGRAPDKSGIDHYVGHYTYAFAEQDIKDSAEYKQHQANLAKAKETPSEPTPTPQPPTQTPPVAPAQPSQPTTQPPEPAPAQPPAPTPDTPAPAPTAPAPATDKPANTNIWQTLIAFLKRLFGIK